MSRWDPRLSQPLVRSIACICCSIPMRTGSTVRYSCCGSFIAGYRIGLRAVASLQSPPPCANCNPHRRQRSGIQQIIARWNASWQNAPATALRISSARIFEASPASAASCFSAAASTPRPDGSLFYDPRMRLRPSMPLEPHHHHRSIGLRAATISWVNSWVRTIGTQPEVIKLLAGRDTFGQIRARIRKMVSVAFLQRRFMPIAGQCFENEHRFRVPGWHVEERMPKGWALPRPTIHGNSVNPCIFIAFEGCPRFSANSFRLA